MPTVYYAHSKHTMCLYWANIAEGGPTLKQLFIFAGRHVNWRHKYLCLNSLMCEEQRTLITVIDGQ